MSAAEMRLSSNYIHCLSPTARLKTTLLGLAILIFIHRKYGSNTKTQQRKHKYKQDTIQNTTIKSITVVDTWYWSINKISYNLDTLQMILVIFGRNVAERGSYRTAVYFSTSPS